MFRAGDAAKSFGYHVRYVLYDTREMVGLIIYVQRGVIWFLVGFVGLVFRR